MSNVSGQTSSSDPIIDKNLPLKAISQGAQDYLVKGEFDSKLLLKTIRFAIERHRKSCGRS